MLHNRTFSRSYRRSRLLDRCAVEVLIIHIFTRHLICARYDADVFLKKEFTEALSIWLSNSDIEIDCREIMTALLPGIGNDSCSTGHSCSQARFMVEN
jgi:hypothetical protein